MIVGTHTATTSADQINLVLRAGPELEFSLRIKAQRMRQGPGKGFVAFGCVEQIVFETDRDASLTDLRELRADRTGRRIYWRDHCPMLGLTIPEEDLIFTHLLPIGSNGRVKLPDIPDPTHIVKNPYQVDVRGMSHLKNIGQIEQPRMIHQKLEKIASSKCGRFLVCHPIAQIITINLLKAANGRPGIQFGTFGSHKLPLSSLTGFDGRKMALLVDPYTGEAYFTGGRYQMPAPDLKD